MKFQYLCTAILSILFPSQLTLIVQVESNKTIYLCLNWCPAPKSLDLGKEDPFPRLPTCACPTMLFSICLHLFTSLMSQFPSDNVRQKISQNRKKECISMPLPSRGFYSDQTQGAHTWTLQSPLLFPLTFPDKGKCNITHINAC